ncbi:PPE domain-containing protein [Mycobacterium sp.]|uniref:PPE domain-containing protein n=1 Tax=Mycobacterium sp. TaxID=1785 RepID=UPI002C8F0D1A|nr:PPE domain-containing protein [Mycobacterium sp.]HTQ20232.1 PPE domain-containing protein [Mycobacterium sp.]
MPDPRWTGPPELIALIFEAGSAASVLANNLVWVTETANKELSMGLSAVNTIATAAQWQGLGAIASMVAATGLNAGLQTLVGWTAHKINVTQAAVEAFVIAQSTVIPSVVSQTNRDEWVVLNATNFFGQNTPGIVERDTEYFGVHWPHNSRIGWTYSGTTHALIAALGIPPPAAPMGASPATPAAAAAAVGQAAGQTGMGDAMQVSGQVGHTAGQAAAAPADAGGQLSSLMQQPMSMVSSVTEPLKGMVQAPMQALQGFGSLPQSMLQSMAGMFPAAASPNAAAAVAEPVLAVGGTAGGLGGASAGGASGLGAFPGAGLTSYTRPTSSFEPENGGRPVGLRAGVLNAAEVRSPTTSAGMGGAPMPMTPAGMLARGSGGESDKDAVTRARVVVAGHPHDAR